MDKSLLHRKPMSDEILASIFIDYYFVNDVVINIRLKTVILSRVKTRLQVTNSSLI